MAKLSGSQHIRGTVYQLRPDHQQKQFTREREGKNWWKSIMGARAFVEGRRLAVKASQWMGWMMSKGDTSCANKIIIDHHSAHWLRVVVESDWILVFFFHLSVCSIQTIKAKRMPRRGCAKVPATGGGKWIEGVTEPRTNKVTPVKEEEAAETLISCFGGRLVRCGGDDDDGAFCTAILLFCKSWNRFYKNLTTMVCRLIGDVNRNGKS